MKKLAVISLVCFSSVWAPIVGAQDKPPPPIKGEAPPAPDKAPAAAKTAVESTKIFDVSELGPIDAGALKEIKAIEAACFASPLSREGMSQEDEVRCNAVVARLTQRGMKAASAIFATLSEPNFEHYYARDRLYFALTKLDDPKVRETMVKGMSRIATRELDDFEFELNQIDEALRGMMGAGPEAEQAPWEDAVATDSWAGGRALAVSWRLFQKENAGKTKTQIKSEHMARARKARTDADPKKAYLAISYLMSQAPREALAAAKTYKDRPDLDEDMSTYFEGLESEAQWRVEEPALAARRF